MQEVWYKRLFRWVSTFFRDTPTLPTPTPRELAQWDTWWGKLYLIRRETPYAVPAATYQFIPAYKTRTRVLLTCDQYRQTRGAGGGDRTAGYDGIRNGTLARGHPVPTHRISLSVVAPLPETNLVKTTILWSYPVDFVGVRGLVDADFDDKYAKIITAKLANLLLYEYYSRINWEQSINDFAARAVNSNHEILLPVAKHQKVN